MASGEQEKRMVIVTIERAKEILAEHKKCAEEWAERYRDLTGNRDEWQEENVQALELAITALERMENEEANEDT